MSISFIHTADLHIGKKFNLNFDVGDSIRRRIDLWETFDKIIELCIRNEIDFLFVAGDLTDGKYCTIEDIERLASKFKEALNTKVVVTTGNKDPYSVNSYYKYIDWPENVYFVETTDSVKKLVFEEEGLCVYSIGLDVMGVQEERKSVSSIRTDEEMVNIFLAHGDIEGNDPPDLRIDVESIRDKFDYIALGHYHQYYEYSDRIIYPGSPEPLSFKEQGQHGVIYGKIDKDNFEKVFLPTAKSRFILKELYLQPEYEHQKILDIIKFIGDYISVSKDYYKVILNGTVNMEMDIEKIKAEASTYFQHIEFVDNYTYDIDYDLLLEEYKGNLIGDFIKLIKEEDENINSQRALMLGLDVMLKEKVGINDY